MTKQGSTSLQRGALFLFIGVGAIGWIMDSLQQRRPAYPTAVNPSYPNHLSSVHRAPTTTYQPLPAIPPSYKPSDVFSDPGYQAKIKSIDDEERAYFRSVREQDARRDPNPYD